MKLSERLRMLRKELKMSQPAVAKKMGLTMRGYQNIELGSDPRYSSLLRIANFYDVSVDWLMGRTEKRTPTGTEHFAACQGETMDFSERIRRLRRAEHLSQPALAKRIGLSMRGYQNMELGTMPRYENLLRIADYYDVSVDWLMGRTENRYAHRS